MKKRWLFFILILSFVLLGCKKDTYEVYGDRTVYTVNTEARTIRHEGETWHYRISGDRSDYEIKIIFPDGSSYIGPDTRGSLTVFEGYEETEYAPDTDLKTLMNHLKSEVPKSPKAFWGTVGSVLLALVLAGCGVFSLLQPETVWRLEHYFDVRGGEPTEWAIFSNRFGGCLLIFAAVLVVVLRISG